MKIRENPWLKRSLSNPWLRVRSERGAVLVVVLGVLALLTVIAVSFVYSTRMTMRASEAYMRTVTATDIAEAGLGNVIAALEADKIYRTGDPRDPTVPVTETYDSLRDDARRVFSAPIVIGYTDSGATDTELEAGDTVTNVISDPEPATAPYPARYLATAKVIGIDTRNDRLYLNSNSPMLWRRSDRLVERGSSFDVTIDTVVKPDARDLDGDSASGIIAIAYTNAVGLTDLVANDTVINTTNNETATVSSKDETSELLYLIPDTNTDIVGNWTVGDTLNESPASTFSADLAAVFNPSDAIWHNYYDESGVLLGRYAVLIQDESSKININVAGNLANIGTTAEDYSTYSHASNEGWSPFEIDLVEGLALTTSPASTADARQIVLHRHGLSGSSGLSLTATPGAQINRVFVAGQGDLTATWGDPTTYDDDDDNYNRLFYRYDGVDNDGDGTIDEALEGMNEPEEFRPLRPVRLRPETWSGGTALDSDGLDNDLDGLTDETNEGDDQPLLTLEQLTDSMGVNLGAAFLTNTVTTNFDGVTTISRPRRHSMSTLSFDRNLTKDGELRRNPNVASHLQVAASVNTPYPPLGTGDTDAFERVDLRNAQAAANIYDYRDRNNARTELHDIAGNTFAGVEAIRINEVMVRAATSLYEAEHWMSNANWTTSTGSGSGSPRGNEGYLTHTTDNGAAEASNSATVILPDPPFSSTGGPANDGNYPFKLRMRVRSDGGHDNSGHEGFTVYINGTQVTSSVYSSFGVSSNGRWATFNQGTGNNNWYVEQAFWTLTSGSNQIYVEKPALTSGYFAQDDVDIDWFYFTLEPDCEWIEMVNIGDRTVSVKNWRVTSEYVKDADETALVSYQKESFGLTLPDVGILPVDSAADWPPGPPHYVVFVIDRHDTVGSTATVLNDIYFDGVWSSLATSANIYQFKSIGDIYSTWIDFFGNEPFDNFNDTTGPFGDRGVYLNVDVGQVSLYDADGNLVDRVTYDYGDVRAGFRSLQRSHPANPGDRLDSNQDFKLRGYSGTSLDPYQDFTVLADGNYDDWQFPWDPDPSASDRHELWWSSPAEANHRSDAYDERVAISTGRMKDRMFSTVGELARVAYHNEFVAVVGYNEGGVAGFPEQNDLGLAVGDVIINESKSDRTAVLMDIYTTDYEDNDNAPSGWMVVKGNYANPVAKMLDGNVMWQEGDLIKNSDASFSAAVTSVKPYDALMGDQVDHYVEIGYTTAGSDPIQGDTITNTTKDPVQTATAAGDGTNNIVHVVMNVDDPVTEWKVGEAISYGVDTATITSVRNKTVTARGLADYFTTSLTVLEAAAATPLVAIQYNEPASPYADADLARGIVIENTTRAEFATLADANTDANWLFFREGSLAAGWTAGDTIQNSGVNFNTTIAVPWNSAWLVPENWPDSNIDPTVYRVDPNAHFGLEWDEDDGVEEGTYDLYGFVNYGTGVHDEVPVHVGPVTIERNPATQDLALTLEIDNSAAAASQYRFMRAALAPPQFTLGRVNVNTAGARALAALPGMDASLAASVIKARSLKPFESVGDVYRTSAVDENFTAAVFSKISSLITTRSDIYKIIVIGQSATDANNNGIIEDDEVTAEKRLEVIYQR